MIGGKPDVPFLPREDLPDASVILGQDSRDLTLRVHSRACE